MHIPPFQVRTAGCIDRAPYHTTPGTRQGDVMLTVFVDGSGSYRNSNGCLHVHGNMAGLVPPVDPGVLMADPGDPYLHYYCRFNGDYAVGLAQAIIEEHGVRFFPIVNAEEVAGYLRHMGRYGSRELPTTIGRREALLIQALVALRSPESTEPPLLVQASFEEYLREHIAEPTNLSRMAEHFLVSRTTLCRVVRSTCGMTVQRMHERLKIEWAQTLLGLGQFNVAQVALRVGYHDPLYFSRVFKRVTGNSPRQWLGSMRGGRGGR